MLGKMLRVIIIVFISINAYAKEDLYTITPSLGADIYFLNGHGGFATKIGIPLLIDFTTLYSQNMDLGFGVGLDEVLLFKKDVNISYDYMGKAEETLNVIPIYLVAKYFVDEVIYSARLGYSNANSSLSWYENSNGRGGASFKSGIFVGASFSYPLSESFYFDIAYKGYLVQKNSWYALENGEKDTRTNYSVINKFGLAISYKLDIIHEKKDQADNSSQMKKSIPSESKTPSMF